MLNVAQRCEKCRQTHRAPHGPWCRNCHVEMMPSMPAAWRLRAFTVGASIAAILFGLFVIWVGIQTRPGPVHYIPPDNSTVVIFPNTPNYAHYNRSM